MYFIKSLFAVAIATCLTAASPLAGHSVQARSDGSCSDVSQFEPIITIGSTTATPFCETDWAGDYTPVTNVTVFWRQYQVMGIQLTYSDGTESPVYGDSSVAYSRSIGVDYAQGERWTGWNYYYSSGAGFAAFRLYTSTGAVLRAGEDQYDINYDGLSPKKQAVGSGFLYGIQGTTTSTLTGLGAFFLTSDVSNIQISNFTFTDGPTGSQNIEIDDLDQATYYNGQSSGNTTWTFQNSDAITTTHTFTSTTTNTYGMTQTFGITLMIPMILSVTSTTAFMWSTAYATANAYTYTKTVTVSWSESGQLSPGTGVQATAAVGHGTGTYPYTSTVTITLKNGYEFSFPEDGALTIDDVSNALVTVVSDDSPS